MRSQSSKLARITQPVRPAWSNIFFRVVMRSSRHLVDLLDRRTNQMDSTRQSNRDRCPSPSPGLLIGLLGGLLVAPWATPNSASAQVRTKKPDRGVYQSPRLSPVTTESVTTESVTTESVTTESVAAEPVAADSRPESASQKASSVPRKSASRKSASRKSGIADLVRDNDPSDQPQPPSQPQREHQPLELVEVNLTEAPRPMSRIRPVEQPHIVDEDVSPVLQQVDHRDVVLVKPQHPQIIDQETMPPAEEGWANESVSWDEGEIIHDGTCDGCSACDVGGCDAIGCDSMYSCGTPWYHRWANSSLCLDHDRWFGGIELLLMFRDGVGLPPLVTTTTDANPDPETAGELGQDGTVVLVGNNSILKDMQAGGRLTLGTWIDRQQCRSLVMRGWFAGEETFGFNANQDQLPVIARPFFNVSDNQTPEEDTQLVAFPDRADGSLVVRASNDVFGGDISVRQYWYGKYGGTVDFLYGYQYMRMNEDLGIVSTSTSLDDDFAPIGSIISVSDVFDLENEFHGGQFGFHTRYREGCWSFDGLLKFGFGSLRRRAKLSGSTFTSIDGANATDPNGLLVRSTNTGTFNDDTFGWVPELSVSLGWQRYPCFDVTVGYQIIAMTDALRVSGAIDPDRAVNLTVPPTGQQRPAAALRYETFYVQGIHFGLQYVY